MATCGRGPGTQLWMASNERDPDGVAGPAQRKRRAQDHAVVLIGRTCCRPISYSGAQGGAMRSGPGGGGLGGLGWAGGRVKVIINGTVCVLQCFWGGGISSGVEKASQLHTSKYNYNYDADSADS